MVKEGFSAEVTFGQSPKYSEGVSHAEICGKSAPSRRISKCKGPEVAACLAFGDCSQEERRSRVNEGERSRRGGAYHRGPSGPL